ncbi:MAG: hypothetical protein ACNA8W_21845 [Bradymonadaceae bacterium]
MKTFRIGALAFAFVAIFATSEAHQTLGVEVGAAAALIAAFAIFFK